MVVSKLGVGKVFVNLPKEGKKEPVDEGDPVMDGDIAEGITMLDEFLT